MKTIHRFFVPSSHIKQGKIGIWGEEAYHLIKILRAKPGLEIRIFNENETEFLCRVIRVKKHEATVEIIEKIDTPVEPNIKINIAQALVKPAKFDIIIQKCTELGAASFHPVISEHSSSRPGQPEKQLKRWDRIALEAAKQSERRRIPVVHNILTLDEFIKAGQKGMLLYLDARTGEDPKILFRQMQEKEMPNEFTVVIGPEGGFSDEEKASLQSAGFLSVNLGPRILRAETAGAAITAIIIYEFDK